MNEYPFIYIIYRVLKKNYRFVPAVGGILNNRK
jgi:hypothetical protein